MAALESTGIVIIGAGVAGAATAAALARTGAGPGLLLEREPIPGAHASGKNAGIARVVEFDPVVRPLAVAGVRRLHEATTASSPLLRPTDGLYLGQRGAHDGFAACVDALRASGAQATLLERARAVARFPLLREFTFEVAVHSPEEGVIDIHALLLAYLEEARHGRFVLSSRTEVQELHMEGGRVAGVVTRGGLIRADLVIDAGGPWAGRLGRREPLPLQPVRRHLFVSADRAGLPSELPIIWHDTSEYYLRPEGRGLLLSACDESPHEPGVPAIDPEVSGMLAAKLLESAPSLASVSIQTSWACLRTFAPDRRPVIGADRDLPGLFHVSGLGGFGMSTSWAVGEVAAALVRGASAPYIDPADTAPERLASRIEASARASHATSSATAIRR